MTDPQELPQDASRDQLESDIEATRDRLVEAVDALVSKFDVKTRVGASVRGMGDRLETGKDEALRTAQHSSPATLVALAAIPLVAVVVVIMVVRRSRRGRRGGSPVSGVRTGRHR